MYCEDPLADALKERVDELKPRSNKWTPEILHLLLELSDRPVEKSNVESLELLYPPREPTPPPLTWKELAAEDPLLRDKYVWRNIDYAVESSDDGEYLDSAAENLDDSETTDLSSVDDQEYIRSENLLRNVDNEELNRLLDARFWGSDGGSRLSVQPTPLTELQAVQETLYMLHGLPTSMFALEEDTVWPLQVFRLRHASRTILAQHLSTLADWGTGILRLRTFVQRNNDIPLVQRLQSAISKRLDTFADTLHSLQRDHLAPVDDQVVSLLAVKDKLETPVQHLLKLSGIIQHLCNNEHSQAFDYLEVLYDETCIAQLAGNKQMYRFLGVLFFECLQVYLRPIRQWMEDGHLSQNDQVFFVAQTTESISPALLWEGKYSLQRTPEGTLYAPRFIQPSADKIFNTGKSVVILQHLGRYEALKASWTTTEPILNFSIVCGDSSLELVPFSALFDVAFANWIQHKHHFTSTTLLNYLFEDCGLWASIQALEAIHFMRDGASSSFLASTVFSKLDSLKDSWNDSFSLTELAQSTYASTPFITEDRIRAISPNVKTDDLLRSRRSVKHLSSIVIEYRLSWPVQLVITPNTIPSYQRIFTFLLQIRRSSTFLNSSRLSQDIDNEHSSADERALYYSTRGRLLWFTNLLHNYITDIVLEKCTSQMRTQLRKAEDVDEMITIHRKSLKKIEDQALLGRKLGPIHKSIISLLDLSIQLVDARNAHIAGKDPEAGKGQVEWNSDSELEEDSFVENVVVEVKYGEELRAIRKKYESLVRFVASGLRSVARVGGEAVGVWDILAEKIEVGLVP